MARIFKRMVVQKQTGVRTEGRIWWVSYTQYGRQERRSLGVTDQRLAELMKAEIERNIERGKAGLPQSFVDVYELFQEYKQAVIKKKSPAYQKRMLQLLKPFLLYVQAEKHLNLAHTTVRDVEHHLNRRKAHLSPRSWNDELREIRRFVKFAVNRDYLAQDPTSKIELQRVVQYSVEVLTPEELDLVFKFAHPASIPFYRVLLYTGMRSGEARHLCWPEVDLTPGKEHVKIRNTPTHLTKTRRDRVVPLCQEAIAVFEELKSKRHPGNPYVFPGRKGGYRGGNRNTWVACLRRIARETDTNIGRGDYRSGLHLFRHTFASYALASGVDIRTVQDWLGHSTIQMTQRYTNLLPDQKHSQIHKLSFCIPTSSCDNPPLQPRNLAARPDSSSSVLPKHVHEDS